MNSSKKKWDDKEFVVRNSLLVDLAENKHIRCIYSAFLAIFVCLAVNSTVYTYLKYNQISLGLRLIKIGFGKFHIVVLAWLLHLLSTSFTFVIFKIWSQNRNLPKMRLTKLWDGSFLVLTVLYYWWSFKIAANIVTVFQLPIASAAVVVIEQVRFLMKVHSFLRNNVPKILKTKSEETKILPKFSQFFYFLFAPTLLYRDTYPRKEKIDYNFISFRLLESVGCIFFVSFVVEKLLNPPLQDFGLRKYTVSEIVIIMVENTATGIFLLIAAFVVVLHSCQNMFAEITRFGDRMFYSDWWTCTNYNCYFKKWNIIVQEWLFLYIFRELRENLGMSSRVAKFSVFLVSAVVHEWILVYTFGFFFPLNFMFIVLGWLVSRIKGLKTPLFNTLFLYSSSLGMATLVTLYTVEYYARKNAPIINPTFLDTLIPRFLTCDCIE